MIPIEQQVTNLDLSQRLAAAGVPQESLWYWEAPLDPRLNWRVCHVNHHEIIMDVHVAAYTPAELGEWLPFIISHPDYVGVGCLLTTWKTHDGWCVSYEIKDKRIWATYPHPTLADTMGEMLLYLIKNGYVKPEELK